MEIGKIQTLEVVERRISAYSWQNRERKETEGKTACCFPKKTGSGGNEDRGLPGSVPL